MSDQSVDVIREALEELDSWPVERVVGQVFALAVGTHSNGAEAFWDDPDDVADLVARHHIGGICYYRVGEDGNRPEVVAAVSARLNDATHVPLLFAVDQEGGMITRVREGAVRLPSAMALAALDDLDTVRELARISGEDLRRAGCNFAYAPVADVNTEPRNPVIGVRSPSSSPEVVASNSAEVIRGLANAGVASCLKHFPGHGDTTVDSHVGLPVLDTTAEDWREAEAVPFREGIAAGADCVMMGHLVAPGLDPGAVPATFSHAIVTGLLRDELGFDGVIVTDALDMAGAGHPGGSAGACVDALLAGNDQLLMPLVPVEGIEGVIEAVRSGRLDLARVRASARRILSLKLRLARAAMPPAQASGVDRDLVAQAFRRAMTWRDPLVTTSLAGVTAVTVVEDIGPADYARGAVDLAPALAEALAEVGIATTVLSAVEGELANGPTVVITRNAGLSPEAVTLAQEWSASAVVVVASRSPYDAALVPAHVPMVLTYGDLEAAIPALVDVLLTGQARGALPVDLVDGEGVVRWPRRVGV